MVSRTMGSAGRDGLREDCDALRVSAGGAFGAGGVSFSVAVATVRILAAGASLTASATGSVSRVGSGGWRLLSVDTSTLQRPAWRALSIRRHRGP
ncbi:hypothetical protein [Advenella kashmirensis]